MENTLDEFVDKLLTHHKFLTELTNKIISKSKIFYMQKPTNINSDQLKTQGTSDCNIPNFTNQNLQQRNYVQGKNKRVTYDKIIEQLYEVIEELIERKMEYQMVQIIEENNKILDEIRMQALESTNYGRLAKENQQCQSYQKDRSKYNKKETNISDNSFNDIKKMINEQLRKMQVHNASNEIQGQKSFMNISATFEKGLDQKLNKIEKIQKKLITLQDRYETNFKSVWNVLSMTESFVHQQKENFDKMIESEESISKQQQKKKNFLGFKW